MNSRRHRKGVHASFHNLKEVWEYALHNELPVLLDKSKLKDKCNPKEYNDYINANDIGVSFYAAVAYMHLLGIISKEIAIGMSLAIEHDFYDEDKLSVADVVRPFYVEFAKKYHVHDESSMDEYLSKIFIPDWCFFVGKEIMTEYFGKCILVNGCLYYIENGGGGESSYLVELSTHVIKGKGKLNNFEPFNIRLCYGPSRILYYDSQNRTIYLNKYGVDNIYITYDIQRRDVEFVKGEFIMCVEGLPFVKTQDNYFAYILGDKLVKLEKYRPSAVYMRRGEEYEIAKYIDSDEWLLVCPDLKSAADFFRPYKLYISDGRTEPIERELEEVILWGHVFAPYRYIHIRKYLLYRLGADTLIPKSSRFSDVEEAIRRCEDSKRQQSVPYHINLTGIMEMLKKHVSEDDDVYELFYTLCEAGKISSDEEFPSKELVFKLKELDLVGQSYDNSLGNILKRADYKTLHDELLRTPQEEDTQETAKEIITKIIGNIGEARVGYFSVKPGVIEIESRELKDGIIAGDIILPDFKKKDLKKFSGIVTYNHVRKESYIMSTTPITKELRGTLFTEFKLIPRHAFFAVQKNLTEK